MEVLHGGEIVGGESDDPVTNFNVRNFGAERFDNATDVVNGSALIARFHVIEGMLDDGQPCKATSSLCFMNPPLGLRLSLKC